MRAIPSRSLANFAAVASLTLAASFGMAQQPAPAADPAPASKPVIKIVPKADVAPAASKPAAPAAAKARPENAAKAPALAAAPNEVAPAANATTSPPAVLPPKGPANARMEKLADHYVEGAGYVTFFFRQTKGYGGTYEECERNCLADRACVMIEFYKPLRKCHLYDHAKWSGKSKDANVALKRLAKSASAEEAAGK